jgi:hypothetical protein
LAIIVFAPLTGECAPVCLLAASISVEAVTPPRKDYSLITIILDGSLAKGIHRRIGTGPFQLPEKFLKSP